MKYCEHMNVAINPLNVVTLNDPYSFYEHLRTDFGLYYDEVLQLWVASSAADVTAVLSHASFRVRPATEFLPHTLLESTAGNIFGNLVRMNDGEKQSSLKRMVSTALDSLNPSKVQTKAEYWSERLYQEISPNDSGTGLRDFCYCLPTYVMGDLIGVPEDELMQVTQWIGEFIRCIAPGGSVEQIAVGLRAAKRLHACMSTQLERSGSGNTGGNLLSILAEISKNEKSITVEQIIANSIGLLTQTYEATAGLISNSVLMLGRTPVLLTSIREESQLIQNLILEILRFDPSIQNTRRFVVTDDIIAGQKMRAGDAILLIVAAANRDPAANPSPMVFDIYRKDAKFSRSALRRIFAPDKLQRKPSQLLHLLV
ncbi:cytochrome P450 [Oxalobacteraceae bacterium GrIS 1.11]